MPRKVDVQAVTEAIEAKGFKCLEPIVLMNGHYRFGCPRCGRELVTRPYKILSGHTKSCGCIKGLKKRKGTEHVTGEYFGVLRRGAVARGLEFTVTIEQLTDLLIAQGFRCALSGVSIALEYNGLKNGTNTASLDRRDNSKGYTPDNVQWVHKDINWMKQDFDQDYFLSLCEKIARTTVGHQHHLSC